MSNLGIGIIGCGNISTSYLRLAPLFKGLEVRAVADMNMDVAQARAEEFSTRAQSVDDLLANKDIDVVINLTIPDAHFAVTKSILTAGKHAYSEKPLVLTLAQGVELRELAKSKGLSVGCAPDTFLGGAHQQARDIIDSGVLGQITTGNAAIQGHGPESWHPNPEFFYNPGAGPIMDMGPYYIANLINLLGPVRRVGALTSSATPLSLIHISEPTRLM
jgi:predicted dehydrogenase